MERPLASGTIALILSTFVAFFATGCAALKDSPAWPSYERSWCYPKATYKHERRRYYGGVSCRF